MKRTIALSFALSLLTATGAFASNSPTQVAATATSSSVTAGQVQIAGPGNKTFDRAHVESSKTVVVAENRKEFGSQYQRY
ncbi:hypothetical protein [Pseudomonas syringae]|uniref:Secreted protein n=1 Tax=Pseudomonas syringae TaxID=317 RepID=A0A085VH16_PSESX|nr:hypothetical protein [Pseudomonas syringae]KFE54729.1 hypothetical protein IV01_14820 [Pseudomonas syringae]